MAQKLTPLHDRVVIRRIQETETIRGGIIIPDSAKKNPRKVSSLQPELASLKKAKPFPWL